MKQYIVTTNDKDSHNISTGVVLGDVEAESPEKAVIEVACQALDYRVQEYPFSDKSMVGMMKTVLGAVIDEDELNISVYEVSERTTMEEDLEFDKA